jgi:hypothetical protein
MARRGLLSAACVSTLAACGKSTETAGGAPSVPMALQEFTGAYRLVDSIRLAQHDSSPVVRVSGLDLDDFGRLAVADASEGNVKLFDRAGRLLRILGRKGEGPGEFSQPRFPRFTRDGGLYVGDGQLGRVLRFDSSGSFLRQSSYNLIPTMGFDLAGNGVALTGSGDQQKALLLGDTAGTRATWLLDIVRLRPRDQPDHPAWKFLSQYWLGVGGDSAYVVTTLSDSVWSVALGGDSIVSYRLEVPGYVAPTPAHEMPRGVKQMMEWQKTFHVAAKVIATPEVVAVPFVQGVLNYGDPMILALRPRGGAWVALAGAPPILHARGDTLIGLLHPDEDPPTLGLFVPRSGQ